MERGFEELGGKGEGEHPYVPGVSCIAQIEIETRKRVQALQIRSHRNFICIVIIKGISKTENL